MSLVFKTCHCDTWPALAWMLTLDWRAREARLCHGSLVEVGPRYFFEGVAADRLADGQPGGDTVLGTGGMLSERGIELLASDYKMHPVYVIVKQGITYASNSLTLVITQSGSTLSRRHSYIYHHRAALDTGWRGITDGLNTIPLADAALSVFVHCAVRIDDRGLAPRRRDGWVPDDAGGYGAYVSQLQQRVDSVLRDAYGPRARAPLDAAVATLSAGYDSTASSVIARRAGCRRAVTIDTGIGDSGESIGRSLGFDTEVVSSAYTWDTTEFATICAFPGNVVHLPWFALKEHVRHRVVFTGWCGDNVWGDMPPPEGTAIDYVSEAGQAGLPEARLWLGAVFVPVPTIGEAGTDALRRISASDEMAPYRTGSAYDRPIPRRLAASAGVASLIAARKMATSAARFWAESLAPAVTDTVNDIRRSLTLEEFWPPATEEVYRKIGWSWQPDRSPERLIWLEATFRWAVGYLGDEYRRRLPAAAPVP